VVEGLPQVVDAIADPQDDLWVRLKEGPIEEGHLAFRWTLHEDGGPRIMFDEGFNAGLGRIQVFECPL
jgi:alpha-amylase/alpha-mannosidase (GH57 family)